MGHIVLFIVGIAIIAAMAWGIANTVRQRRSLDQAYQRENSSEDYGDIPFSEIPEEGMTAGEPLGAVSEHEMASFEQSAKPVFTSNLKGDAVSDSPDISQDFSNADAPQQAAQSREVSRAAEAGLILLHVMAPRSKQFSGAQLLTAFRHHKLVYGKKCIFHAYDRAGSMAFSVASAVEPGIFDLEHMQHFSTPGLGFFLDLNRVDNPREAFNHMLQVAKNIATTLGGDILDEHYERLGHTSMADYLSRLRLAETAEQSESEAVIA